MRVNEQMITLSALKEYAVSLNERADKAPFTDAREEYRRQRDEAMKLAEKQAYLWKLPLSNGGEAFDNLPK